MKSIYFGAAFVMMFLITACQETAFKGQEDSKGVSKQSGKSGLGNGSDTFRDTVVKIGAEELEKFLTVQPEIDSIRSRSKEKMLISLEKANLDIERFNEIRAVAEDPSTNSDVSRADLENFKTVYIELEEIEGQAEKQISERLEQVGMSRERYMEISDAVENNPELQERVKGEKG